jgi:hypothetical protein
MRKNRYEILKQTGTSYNLPIFLESSVDEMGVMVGFDGDIEQMEQLVNFSYTQTSSTVQVYSTVNPDKLRKIVEQTYTINWGDGLTSGLTVNSGVVGQSFPSLSHTYGASSGYTITITLDAPWTKQKLSKKGNGNIMNESIAFLQKISRIGTYNTFDIYSTNIEQFYGND